MKDQSRRITVETSHADLIEITHALEVAANKELTRYATLRERAEQLGGDTWEERDWYVNQAQAAKERAETNRHHAENLRAL